MELPKSDITHENSTKWQCAMLGCSLLWGLFFFNIKTNEIACSSTLPDFSIELLLLPHLIPMQYYVRRTMYDDIRLHVARPYTPADNPFSFISSFTLSNHLLLGLPLFLLPCRPLLSIEQVTYFKDDVQ